MNHVLQTFSGIEPRIGQRVYLAPGATLIGDVEIGDDASIWPNTVIRADVNRVCIGARSSVQDGTVIHVSGSALEGGGDGYPTLIGCDVTVGHRAILHGCRIADFALIGMGSIILDGATIGCAAMIGAGSLVPSGRVVGDGELWFGNPARFVRHLNAEEIQALHRGAAHYVAIKDRYLTEPHP
ncbi:gamma carbonic anhydrase family protein [Pseudoxanthomonas jiangsuensis]|uniref:gamma carbonic anhydrase family protein n=1 Tax=Pseudoxanthomonas jiangsuensis TaxID=619688 RepID=UPI0013909A70|nr:gamma carbonic anhydrase family protein [Pseudoxanthomonas jiangsuensis]KAF1697263.1 gamma carbonic anhydrase family protein [Pseudoxanthomonas jiangsuensis]